MCKDSLRLFLVKSFWDDSVVLMKFAWRFQVDGILLISIVDESIGN